jgi:hypothetical protein
MIMARLIMGFLCCAKQKDSNKIKINIIQIKVDVEK